MLGGDVTDQLLDQDRLSYTCTTEESDFTTLLIGAEKVNDLDTGLQDLRIRRLLGESRSLSVDRMLLLRLRCRFLINGFTQNIEDTSQGLLSHGNPDRTSCGFCCHTAYQTVGGAEGDAAYDVVTQMLGHLNGKRSLFLPSDQDSVIDIRQLAFRKTDIQNRADDLCDFTLCFCSHYSSPYTHALVVRKILRSLRSLRMTWPGSLRMT